jgi:hypothetical protein
MAKAWFPVRHRFVARKQGIMRPWVWLPPVDLSPAEERIVKRIRRAKLFVFLRQQRAELFSPVFQEELAAVYKDSPLGQPPVWPAQVALAIIIQAYTGVSDDEVIEALTMDRRWQLALDCLDCEKPPFSKGTLVGYRQRMIEHGIDRRLIERTVEIAEQKGGFGSRQLRAALDSSPLWGGSRVEDTYNLLGHALRKALGVIARQQGRGLAAIATEVGTPILGGSSLKAALDLNWDDPMERQRALVLVLDALDEVQGWIAEHPEVSCDPVVQESLTTAQQVRDQDVEMKADGQPALRQGVAKDRRIAVEDPEMRHGRKSRSQRINGYKRHVLRDLDTGLVRAVGVTQANAPEATVTDDIVADLAPQGVSLKELHIDRAYLSSLLVRERPDGLEIYCKAWPVRNGDRFPKTAFQMDWEQGLIRCPNGIELPFEPGGTVHFPAEQCAVCAKRDQCTKSRHGRSVSVHPDERLLVELRKRQLTPAGRAKLRERVDVEHSLAHVGRWQGDRARYLGVRKNVFDTRRSAVVHNLHVISHLPAFAKAA